jgi:hypothetical protein
LLLLLLLASAASGAAAPSSAAAAASSVVTALRMVAMMHAQSCARTNRPLRACAIACSNKNRQQTDGLAWSTALLPLSAEHVESIQSCRWIDF